MELERKLMAISVLTKPYYQDESCTIYHGDCALIVPQLMDFDLLLTDPPYGINENSKKQKTRSNLAKPTDYGEFNWDKKISNEYLLLLQCIAKSQIIFGGNYYADKLPPNSCWLVWDKDNGSSDFADCELAWTNLKKAVRLFRYRWSGMLQQNMKNKDKRVHPTQKPLSLMKWCIELAGDVNTIIDPFMGSGTTLRAAKDLGKKAVGIDIDERYCEIAAERLRQQSMGWG